MYTLKLTYKMEFMMVCICIEQMMMYLEIQPIAFRCKFFMHVSVKDMREKVSLKHNISSTYKMLPRICKSISDNRYGLTTFYDFCSF